MNRESFQFGITLMELMIVVAIVAILAAVAYPGYSSYVQRGRITEATATLSELRIRLEQFYQDNRNYGSTPASCGIALPAGPSLRFSYACNWGPGGNDQEFLLTATGTAGGGMAGYAFTIDHTNAKQTTAFPGVTGARNCWILKKGDSC